MSLREQMELVDLLMRRPQELAGATSAVKDTIDGERLQAVHESFAALVVARWWQARFPAALATLDHVLGGPAATASFLVGAAAFPSAVEEDLTGAAFAGAALDGIDAGELDAPPWLPELIGYEYLIGTGLPRRARGEAIDAELEARLLPAARRLSGGRLLDELLVAPWQWPVGALQEEPHDAEPAPYVSLFRLEGSEAVEVEAPDVVGDLLDLLAADADLSDPAAACGPEAPEALRWLEELGLLR